MEAGGAIHSLLLQSLLCGLGLVPRHLLRRGGLDYAHSHGLPHVTNSEPEIGKFTIACARRIRRREELLQALPSQHTQRQLRTHHFFCQLFLRIEQYFVLIKLNLKL